MTGRATRVETNAMVAARLGWGCCTNSVSPWNWAVMLAMSVGVAVRSPVSSISSGPAGGGLGVARGRLEGEADLVSLEGGPLRRGWRKA